MKLCLNCTRSIPDGSRKRCTDCAKQRKYTYNYFYKKDNPDKMRKYRQHYRRRKKDANKSNET